MLLHTTLLEIYNPDKIENVFRNMLIANGAKIQNSTASALITEWTLIYRETTLTCLFDLIKNIYIGESFYLLDSIKIKSCYSFPHYADKINNPFPLHKCILPTKTFIWKVKPNRSTSFACTSETASYQHKIINISFLVYVFQNKYLVLFYSI